MSAPSCSLMGVISVPTLTCPPSAVGCTLIWSQRPLGRCTSRLPSPISVGHNSPTPFVNRSLLSVPTSASSGAISRNSRNLSLQACNLSSASNRTKASPMLPIASRNRSVAIWAEASALRCSEISMAIPITRSEALRAALQTWPLACNQIQLPSSCERRKLVSYERVGRLVAVMISSMAVTSSGWVSALISVGVRRLERGLRPSMSNMALDQKKRFSLTS